MKITLLCFVIFTACFQTCYGQTNSAPDERSYYLDIRGVDSKQKCRTLIESVRKKTGVLFFETHRFPSEYFLLKANVPLSEKQVYEWCREEGVQLIFFGEGSAGLERLVYNKRKQ